VKNIEKKEYRGLLKEVFRNLFFGTFIVIIATEIAFKFMYYMYNDKK